MGYLQNLHQHTCYCDGKNTPEEVVQEALKRNFKSIGFSGHSHMSFSDAPAMNPEKLARYKADIAHLQEKYGERIDIFCGLEEDMLSKSDLSGFDYVIGSCHFLLQGEEYIDFDRDAATVAQIIEKNFAGDGMAYAKAYYAQLATLPEYGKYDIVGHFDLITKHCETADFFDTESKAYRHAAMEAMEALAGKVPYFEVNTGAVARGYRTTAYPMPWFIKEFKRLGFGVIISSDCHDKNYLDCYFREAEQLLLDCGYREKFVLTKNGFMPVGLEKA